MLVQKLTEFINHLRCKRDTLSSFDTILLDELEEIVLAYDHSLEINEELFDSICLIFAKRWEKVFDTIYDYTINSTIQNNDAWIDLAKELAFGRDKSALQILIPAVKNRWDSLLLERLNGTTDLGRMFLSESGETIYTHRGLLARLLKGHSFAIWKGEKNLKSRPLSLRELYRIALKSIANSKGNLENGKYEKEGEHRKKPLWTILKDDHIPKWKSKGELPKHVLQQLLQSIELFFQNRALGKKPDEFLKKLLEWSKVLLDFSVKDVNHLYGQVIKVGDKEYFLLEILIECLIYDENLLAEKLYAVAAWIHQIDASLVSQREEFQTYYATNKTGKWLDIDALKIKIRALNDNDVQIQGFIAKLLNMLEGKSAIDAEIIEALEALYALRWSKVAGTDKDYTRLQHNYNAPWIDLAQNLSGANLLSKNYYCFLMPTLIHETDKVTKEPLSNFPLSHYILSEDGNELILLDNCVNHYKANRTFYNCNSFSTKPLTPREIARIEFAHSKFHWGIEKANTVYDDPPLKLTTILEVKRLVDRSLFVSGLTQYEGYSIDENTAANSAYDQFQLFLDALPIEERNRLLEQNILLYSKWRSVKEILDDVYQGALQLVKEANGEKIPFSDQEGCIAVAGTLFAQLVIDYDPNLAFRPDLEEQRYFKTDLIEMRKNSRNKYFRENYDNAVMKIQTLLVSLLTYDFSNFSDTLVTIHLDGFTNRVPEQVVSIFDKLNALFISKDCKNAPNVLNEIENKIVKSQIDAYKSGWWNIFTPKSPKLSLMHDWLKSIISENMEHSLFANTVMYDQIVILDVLLSLDPKSNSGQFFDSLINEMLRASVESHNLIHNNVLINLKIDKLLKEADELVREEVLQALHDSNSSLDHNEFKNKWSNILSQRLQKLKQPHILKENTRLSFFEGNKPSAAPRKLTVESVSLNHFIDNLLRISFIPLSARSNIFSNIGQAM